MADIAMKQLSTVTLLRFQQLLANLLSNAVAHGAANQPIKVTARADHAVVGVAPRPNYHGEISTSVHAVGREELRAF